MIVNVNVIYYVHVCEQARWARSAGNSAIENWCIIIIIYYYTPESVIIHQSENIHHGENRWQQKGCCEGQGNII